MIMSTIWAKAAKLRCASSRDFTRVSVYLVVQIDLLRWKVVHCGQLTLQWTLIVVKVSKSWQQCIDSKISRIVLKDIVMLDIHVCWSFLQTHDNYHMPLGLCPMRHNNSVHVEVHKYRLDDRSMCLREFRSPRTPSYRWLEREARGRLWFPRWSKFPWTLMIHCLTYRISSYKRPGVYFL